jgi:hypothetical protein
VYTPYAFEIAQLTCWREDDRKQSRKDDQSVKKEREANEKLGLERTKQAGDVVILNSWSVFLHTY